MNPQKRLKTNYPKPICIGTGLIALDVVINGDPKTPPKFWAGGSCGNVLTILSYLGWDTYPIARLRDDIAAKELVRDMELWSVRTRLVHQDSSGSTPIFIEKIGCYDDGTPWHRFKLSCPNCGSWLPRYKPVPKNEVEQMSKELPQAKVFYFDRATPSSLELIRQNKKRGAIIFFEPTKVKDEDNFRECIRAADIVKYSDERVSDLQEADKDLQIPLEIKTLGGDGLKYRTKIGGGRRIWKNIPAYSVEKLRDAAGAGDWCSAGVIHLLASNGRQSFENTTTEKIESALRFGQLLSALNCYFEGARGIMYNIPQNRFNEIVNGVWQDSSTPEVLRLSGNTHYRSKQIFNGGFCPACK